MKKLWFYGIYGIQYISHGEWSDPELIWHKKSFNYYHVKDYLWDIYEHNMKCENKQTNDAEFAIWVKKNAYLARECLQELMDNKWFYGGQYI